MDRPLRPLCLLLTVLLGACSSPALVLENPALNLPGAGQYAWADTNATQATQPGQDDPLVNNSAVHDTIRTAIAQDLTQSGYRPGNDPGWLVSYSIGVHKAMVIHTNNQELECRFLHTCVSTAEAFPATKATLIIEITDAHTHQLLWRAILTRDISEPGELQSQKLRQAVNELLAKLPKARPAVNQPS